MHAATRPHSRPAADNRDSLSRLSNWLIAAVKLVSKWLTRCVQSELDKSVDLALCDEASCLSVDGPRYLVLSRSCVRRTDSAPVVPSRCSRIVASVRRVIAVLSPRFVVLSPRSSNVAQGTSIFRRYSRRFPTVLCGTHVSGEPTAQWYRCSISFVLSRRSCTRVSIKVDTSATGESLV